MPKVRWAMSYGFCSKFQKFAVQAAYNVSTVRDSGRALKGGNFFETQCSSIKVIVQAVAASDKASLEPKLLIRAMQATR